ncbi:6-bladed beta-propeller, partial [Escherichia coli]
RISKFAADGKFITKWGSEGTGDGQFTRIEDIAVDPSSGDVYVAELGNGRISKFAADGKFITKWGSEGTGDGQFTRIEDIAVDPSSGDVYVAELG